MCRKNYCFRAAKLPDEIPYLDDLVGIETACRFVQDEHFGVVDHRLSQTNALAVSFRQLANIFVPNFGKSTHLYHLPHSLPHLSLPHFMELGGVLEILQDVHVEVEGIQLR